MAVTSTRSAGRIFIGWRISKVLIGIGDSDKDESESESVSASDADDGESDGDEEDLRFFDVVVVKNQDPSLNPKG